MPSTTATTNSSAPPDNSTPRDWQPLMSRSAKPPSKYTDPCAHAAAASMKCLEDNGYDRTRCTRAFEEYRECKKTWVLQRREDRARGREGAHD